MTRRENAQVSDGSPVAAADIAEAVTRAPFTYGDGATQVFTPDGRTTFTERGRPTSGEWGVDDRGRFWSFWPPDYRASYHLAWIADAGVIVGVRFTETGRGETFEGRYT
jgi:hypothetical protein